MGAVLAGLLLVGLPCAFALNPALDASQYAHTAWKVREGFSKGVINAVTQTPDGYLWLGTEFGLLRFDGVRNVAWEPPKDQPLPSSHISKLLAARDGTLWIGTLKGLASWKSGKLTRYPELAGQAILALVEDREGSVWAGSYGTSTGRLCGIQKSSIQCYGEDGRLGNGVRGLYQDSKGNLWAGVVDGLWQWKPGPPKFHSMPGQVDGIPDFSEGDDGALLIATRSGIQRLVDGRAETYPLAGAMQQSIARRVLRDHDGGLWVGTSDRGLIHLHQGSADVFARPEGLSGDFISSLFEDREGNIWVATQDGLDRFREFAVPTYSVSQGLSSARIGSVLAAQDGSVWLATSGGLNRWNNGRITAYRGRDDRSPTPVAPHPPLREVVGSGLPNRDLASLFQDKQGRIWVSTLGGFGYLENDKFVPVKGIPGGFVDSVAEDTAGNLWMANRNLALFRLSPDHQVQQIPWARLRGEDSASSSAADSSGGLWLGFSRGGLLYLKDGQVRASYSATEGLGEGQVNALQLDGEGSLWAATEGGLSRLKNGRIATLTRQNGLPCDTVHWVVEDNDRSFWLYTACGLLRIQRADLDTWATHPNHRIQAAVYEIPDGVRIRAVGTRYSPSVAKSKDGKLWFVHGDGVSVVDPLRLPVNSVPPPVHIEAVKINGKEAQLTEGMALSHHNNDLEIEYTALSLTIPERVRFKYMLEGKDTEWHDAGTNRRVSYSDLAPRKYRFRVMARNNDGVWNKADAAWNFSIVPAFYQTMWFEGLGVVAVAGLTWLLYRLRLQQITARLSMLHTERLAERARIARDLHDTLLQSLAGVSLQLHGISKQAATAPEKTQSSIDHVRQQVDAAFREARMKVYDLRSPALEGQDLAAALSEFVERIGPATSARCVLTISGQPRQCTPEVEEELLRIAQEAANNAIRHAQANQIRIILEYRVSSLTLSVSDDGCGFDFEEGYRKSGHWGLKSMLERAAQIRGKCKITSAPGRGTQVEVRVPLSSWSVRNIGAKHANSSSGSR